MITRLLINIKYKTQNNNSTYWWPKITPQFLLILIPNFVLSYLVFITINKNLKDISWNNNNANAEQIDIQFGQIMIID